jgi:hypothetical protein
MTAGPGSSTEALVWIKEKDIKLGSGAFGMVFGSQTCAHRQASSFEGVCRAGNRPRYQDDSKRDCYAHRIESCEYNESLLVFVFP